MTGFDGGSEQDSPENENGEHQEFRERAFSNSNKLVPITDDYEATTGNDDVRKSGGGGGLDREHVKGLMARWRSIAKRVRSEYVDPWDQFNIQEYPVQRAKRYRYSAIRKKWTEDMVEIRLHPEPFARGAMRECYRLKKRPSLVKKEDWNLAQNYVAKKYINQVDRRVLFDDVRLQMDAKLWSEEYNRYNPPKKIDIVQMCVIELIDEPKSPLYHLEHFIEGDYLKYNSNSGFVSKDARLTPQAFSHFTFERSGHQMMVVDIQGVGDLYTDPQIHTVVGTDYGDGNLGTRGMALFFHSHRCNHICESMEMSHFELSPPENEENEGVWLKPGEVQNYRNVEATTFSPRMMRMSSECVIEKGISMDELRRRNTLNLSNGDLSSKLHNDECVCVDCIPTVDQLVEPLSDGEMEEGEEEEEDLPRSETNSCNSRRLSRMSISTRSSGDESVGLRRQQKERGAGFVDMNSIRQRHDSFRSSIGTYSMNSSRLTRDTEREEFWKLNRKQAIPANIAGLAIAHYENDEMASHQFSILGQIHIDLARYHELGRFVLNDPEQKEMLDEYENDPRKAIVYDKQSAIFHLDIARKCGILEAILTTAHIVLGMPHELLKEITVQDLFPKGVVLENGIRDVEEFGSDLMEIAAEMGDRGAMLFMANSYETGRQLGPNKGTDYKKSIEWYQRVVGFQDEVVDTTDASKDAFSSFSPLSRHEILAKMAEMYKEGGYGLNRDFDRAYNLFNEAAEAAMEAMNGKLANKYYEKAEMCGE